MSELDEARRFFLSRDLIIPILEQKKKTVLEQMTSEFRQGDREQTHNIAQLSVYADLIGLITRKSLAYEQLMNEEHNKE